MNHTTRSEDVNLKAFAKIRAFAKELNDCFGQKHHNVELYNRLLKKTDILNKVHVSKQVKVFEDFLVEFKTEIINKSKKGLADKNIKFSEKVFFNIGTLLSESDKETTNVIFSHLQIILFVLHPDAEVKTALQKSASEQTGTSSGKFIDTFMNKIENTFKEKNFKDAGEAISGLMSSNVMGELIESMNQGVESGDLNLNDLLSDVQGMLGNLTGTGGSMDIGSMMGMLGPLMGGGAGQPDLNALLKQATGENVDINEMMEKLDIEEPGDSDSGLDSE
jgi:hypothetical protein